MSRSTSDLSSAEETSGDEGSVKTNSVTGVREQVMGEYDAIRKICSGAEILLGQ